MELGRRAAGVMDRRRTIGRFTKPAACASLRVCLECIVAIFENSTGKPKASSSSRPGTEKPPLRRFVVG
jgi:hypothetical protein